jgi:hypothetical protein
VVAPIYYPDPSLRPLGDVGILIHEKDIPGGQEGLERLGYTFYSRSAKDYVYIRGSRKKNVWASDNVHPVEIHFRLDWYLTTGRTFILINKDNQGRGAFGSSLAGRQPGLNRKPGSSAIEYLKAFS